MKVKCIDLRDSDTGESIDRNSWLTTGKTYMVLSVFIGDLSEIEYRLLSDDGCTPAMFKAKQFRVVDNALPSNWVCQHTVGSYFELAPKSWAVNGFWESYFDGDHDALEQFDIEKRIILETS